MKVNRKVKDIPWMPHPVVPGISIKPLISSKDHNLDVTCMLVTVPVGIGHFRLNRIKVIFTSK